MRYCLMYGFAGIERATIAGASAVTGAGLLRLRGARVHAADLLRRARVPDQLLPAVAGRRDAHNDGRALLDLPVREQRELRLRGRLLDALAGALAARERDHRALGDAHRLQRDDLSAAVAQDGVTIDHRRRIERDLHLHRPPSGA